VTGGNRGAARQQAFMPVRAGHWSTRRR